MGKEVADSDQEINPKSPEGNSEVKDVEYTSEVLQAEVESNLPLEPTSETAAVENTRTKSTHRKPSNATLDKEVCDGPTEVESPVSPTASNAKSSSSAKKSEPSTPHVARKYMDDEDSWSMSSSGASGRTMRSRTTVGVAPTFTCNERLERRKEYYTKLEEKRKALESEKREYEARTKEEEEAAIKQLRKNMVFRASPVPSFYYEKPPPKKELKKLPTTRAVSPKLGRRKSCGDMASFSPEETICARSWRHSLGSGHKEGLTTSKHRDLHQLVGGRNAASKVKDRSKQVKETTKNTHPKIQQTNADIAVQS